MIFYFRKNENIVSYLVLSFSLTLFSFIFGFFNPVSYSDEVKVGFILATEKEERYKKDKMFFLDEAEKLGMKVFYDQADNSIQRQKELIVNLEDKGVKVLVIQPVDSSLLSEEIQKLHSKGIKIVAYDRIIYDADIDFFVTHDSRMVGIIQAQEAVKYTGGKGNYVILAGGKNHSVAKQITSGNLLILDKYPGMKRLGIFYHENWDEKESYRTMKELLRKTKDINVVLANNSSLIRGAIKALEEEGGKDVFTAGADADLENCRLIIKGKQNIDILKPIEPLARTAARVAYSLSQGKIPQYNEKMNNGKVDVKVILIPVHLVSISTIDDVIIKPGIHSREAIYGK
jgi:D-xylose transport system substrate-binding protein